MQLFDQRLLGFVGLLSAAAHGALPAVDTSLPAGAQCMSDYLAAVLRPQSTLLIDGDVAPLFSYLRHLAPGTPKVLRTATDENLADMIARLRQTMTMSRTLQLVVKRSGKGLLDFVLERPAALGLRHRQVLLWTWAPSAQDVLKLTASSNIWMCGVLLNLAVTTPDGTTFLYSVTSPNCQEKWQDIHMKEISRCSPGLRLWPKGTLPEPMCLEWKPRGPGKSPIRVIASEPPPELGVVVGLYKEIVVGMVGRVQPVVQLDWIPHNTKNVYNIFAGAANCNIEAFMSFFPLLVNVEPHLQFEAVTLHSVLVVVPAGLDPHPSLLKAVTAEFSVALWVATALAVVGMTAALAVASACRGRPRLAALAGAPLQALAPLLAQAPPGRTAHRPLSAVWLLMSVVLAAAYQGMLLRELTSPPGEINSLEQLEQSGLDVLIVESLYKTGNDLLPASITSRAQYIPPNTLNAATKNMSEGRKSALICLFDMSAFYQMVPYVYAPAKQLHLFRLPYYNMKALSFFSKGSPIHEQLQSAFGLARSGGLFLHYNRAAMIKLRPRERGPDPGDQLTRPLSLDQLLPAFVVLAAGHLLGALVFALELLCRTWAEHGRPAGPPVRVFLH
ncbi:Ionotropic receptor 213 [Frankliniella occidentalis]|nr:Ionotropic receptor 213 [Frankliniella occidentalis]